MLPCPTCKKKVSEEAVTCPKCGQPLEQNQKFQAMRKAQKRGGVFGLVLLLIVLGFILSREESTNKRSTTTQVSVTSPAPKKALVDIGSVVKLRSGAEVIVLGRTKNDYDSMAKAYRADDSHGRAQLLLSGRAFKVPAGTKARIIDQSWTMRQVRILEGQSVGRAGWIPAEWARDLVASASDSR